MNDYYKIGDFDPILDIFKEKDGLEMTYYTDGGRVFFTPVSANSYAELMIRLFPRNQLTVARIGVDKEHRGTGTAIINFLENYCREKGLEKLIIEQVCSKEMYNLCNKLGFKLDEFLSIPIPMDGFMLGCYSKEIVK